MVNFTILAGGYTSFVASYLFNSETNALSLLNTSPTGDNPSWIALHPTNKSILYAVNENSPGSLQTFVIGSQGLLSSPFDTIYSDGDAPAFATPLSGAYLGQVAVMDYNSGTGLIVPTTPDALHFGSGNQLTFPAPVSHPHMALQHGESEVFVPDLGADKVWRLAQDGKPGDWKIQGQIVQPTGSGPRHAAIRGNTLYVLHELASTLTQQNIPPAPNGTTGPLIANFSIIPPDPPVGADFAAGEILLTEPSLNFPAPYIYVSNRNTGVQDPKGDAIVIFQVEPELKLLKYVYTGLDQIRGMQLGGPEDEFLIAGGVNGTAGVVMLRRTDGGRDLELFVRNTELPTRTSFVWLPTD
ncbi:putative isomerase YbhE [Obba rivulosa]|uniref:Putative isomerase YbhE n=1 Tax=Obba rivulosa TaxID=1052685 RepID=A0A8E2AZ02_9APHY|nr:putative isomerase YbhE [Obba rivulosa]